MLPPTHTIYTYTYIYIYIHTPYTYPHVSPTPTEPGSIQQILIANTAVNTLSIPCCSGPTVGCTALVKHLSCAKLCDSWSIRGRFVVDSWSIHGDRSELWTESLEWKCSRSSVGWTVHHLGRVSRSDAGGEGSLRPTASFEDSTHAFRAATE